MTYFRKSLVLLLILLPASSYANEYYDVNYFKNNPDDIAEQLDICRIQVWNAKASGSLASVKAAKNDPSCIAAKKAREQLKAEEFEARQRQYEQQKKAREALKLEATELAQGSTIEALKASKETCDREPHSILGQSGSDCAKLSHAINVREKLDTENSINSYRTSGGKMSEKERFILLSRPLQCQKSYTREVCRDINRAQNLDEQAYREKFREDRKAAEAVVEDCKIPFFKALAEANAIQNAGDKNRAVSNVVNLYKPPFNNPLACQTAARSMGTSFGMMKPE
ncbi:MAG: hypothetical protein ACPGVT_11105 [Maricaulaceae bacterium]